MIEQDRLEISKSPINGFPRVWPDRGIIHQLVCRGQSSLLLDNRAGAGGCSGQAGDGSVWSLFEMGQQNEEASPLARAFRVPAVGGRIRPATCVDSVEGAHQPVRLAVNAGSKEECTLLKGYPPEPFNADRLTGWIGKLA